MIIDVLAYINHHRDAPFDYTPYTYIHIYTMMVSVYSVLHRNEPLCFRQTNVFAARYNPHPFCFQLLGPSTSASSSPSYLLTLTCLGSPPFVSHSIHTTILDCSLRMHCNILAVCTRLRFPKFIFPSHDLIHDILGNVMT